MRYVSVCSGMEAATVAWHPLGWTPLAFSEIEPFPKALLQYKYPNIPNYGDLTKFDEWPLPVGNVDLVVGGTPCQAWSVAGKRLGLDDPRGRVALAYARFIEKHRPRWLVWENVPGVYSAGKPGGADFAAFVGALAKLGYHIAYRTLNAEFFGVPQRRRRCILVGYLGDWRPAAAVLFEPESLCRDIEKGRKARKGIASGPKGGAGPSDGYFDFQAIGKYGNDGSASTLMARDYKDAKDLVIGPVCATGDTTHSLTASHRGSEDGTGRGTPIVIDRAAFNQGVNAQYAPHIAESETMDTLVSKGPHAVGVPFRKAKRASSDKDDETWVEADTANTLNLFDLGDTRTTHAIVEPTKPFCADVAPTITSSGPPFSRTGNERTEAEALVVQPRIYENHPNDSRVTGPHDVAPTVTSRYGTGGGNVPLVNNEEVPQPIAFQPGNLMRRAGSDPSTEVFPTVKCDTGDQSPHVANAMAVRRLTPEECEALQGFPKGYSKIPWKGKPADQCPDGPRYKACGNSMAVPVMSWVGQRIALVDKLISQTQPEQPKP